MAPAKVAMPESLCAVVEYCSFRVLLGLAMAGDVYGRSQAKGRDYLPLAIRLDLDSPPYLVAFQPDAEIRNDGLARMLWFA